MLDFDTQLSREAALSSPLLKIKGIEVTSSRALHITTALEEHNTKTHLAIDSCTMVLQDPKLFFSKLPLRIVALAFTTTGFGADFFSALVTYCTENIDLEALVIDDCGLSHEQLSILCKALSNHPNLKKIGFNGQVFNAADIEAIVALLKSNPQLECLSLQFNAISVVKKSLRG